MVFFSAPLEPLVGEERDEVAAAGRVAPLVVVPGHRLRHIAVEQHGRWGVEDRRAGVVLEVARYQLVALVVEVALHRPLGGGEESLKVREGAFRRVFMYSRRRWRLEGH